MKKLWWLLFGISILTGCTDKEGNQGNPAISTADTPKPAGLVTIPPDSPKLEHIRVEPVRVAEIPTDEVVSPGKIEANPNRLSRVGLPVAGRIVSVKVKLGDAVTSGQPLLEIESPDAEAAMSTYLQSEASVTQAKASLVKSQADFDRASDLYEHNAIAKKEVLSAENTLAQSKAALEQASASREQALRRLEILGLKAGNFGQKVVVRAPIAGKVLEMSIAPGEYRNDTNAPLITIADLSTVWVASDVPESYIRFIQVGERVDTTLLAYPGETFFGRVTRIADTVDPQTRTVKVRAELDNSRGRFRPEMYGSIHHIDSTRQMPVLPVGAVIQGDGDSIVFVERSRGGFQQTTVRVGKRSGDMVPILSGLKAGERVVVDGAMLLKGP